jgi:hypothetical protein
VREYGALLECSLSVLNVTWFSDEAHIHLEGYINKQNIRLFGVRIRWGHTVASPLHPELQHGVHCRQSKYSYFGSRSRLMFTAGC